MEGSNSQRSIPAYCRIVENNVIRRIVIVDFMRLLLYLALPVERPPEGKEEIDHLLTEGPQSKDDPVGHPVHILLQ